MPPKVRTAKPNIKPVQVPLCPRHNQPMFFDRLNNRWACREPECRFVTYPKNDFDAKRPTILSAEAQSDVELVIYQKENSADGMEHVYVRHLKTGVLIEITQAIRGWSLQNVGMHNAPEVSVEFVTRSFAWY